MKDCKIFSEIPRQEKTGKHLHTYNLKTHVDRLIITIQGVVDSFSH